MRICVKFATLRSECFRVCRDGKFPFCPSQLTGQQGGCDYGQSTRGGLVNLVRKPGGNSRWGDEQSSIGVEFPKIGKVSGNMDGGTGKLLNSRGFVDADN